VFSDWGGAFAEIAHRRGDRLVGEGSNPASPFPRAWLASAFALKGDRDLATNELAEAHRLGGSMGYNSVNRMRTGYWGTPAIRALYEATFFCGLRKAGVPEE